jgi:hypothetical protein
MGLLIPFSLILVKIVKIIDMLILSDLPPKVYRKLLEESLGRIKDEAVDTRISILGVRIVPRLESLLLDNTFNTRNKHA